MTLHQAVKLFAISIERMTFITIKRLSVVALLLVGASVPLTLWLRQNSHANTRALPDTFLWAWERPEHLDFINPDRVGVAYLAKTIRLRDNKISVRPRTQPLIVPPGTKVIAVVRIESDYVNPALRSSLLEETANEVAELGKLSVSGVQVDFDATLSEREFYRQLLSNIRERLPRSLSFSMTALASWCSRDNWLADLPVDEVVPMLFRLGVDRNTFTSRLQSGEEVLQKPCTSSAGVSTDEVIQTPARKRLYIFSPNAWTATALNHALETYQR